MSQAGGIRGCSAHFYIFHVALQVREPLVLLGKCTHTLAKNLQSDAHYVGLVAYKVAMLRMLLNVTSSKW